MKIYLVTFESNTGITASLRLATDFAKTQEPGSVKITEMELKTQGTNFYSWAQYTSNKINIVRTIKTENE